MSDSGELTKQIAEAYKKLSVLWESDEPAISKIISINSLIKQLNSISESETSDSSVSFLNFTKRHLTQHLISLRTQLHIEIPAEAARSYRKWVKEPDRVEKERQAKAWQESYDVCLKNGGPWRHYDCGEVFTTSPNIEPECPKCNVKKQPTTNETVGDANVETTDVAGQGNPTEEAAKETVKSDASYGETDLCYYWQMGRLPKLCPERIYFVWDGAIRAYHEVISMVPSQGRIYMKTKIHNIHPIPMKGFRGFRYYDRDRGCVW